MAVAINMAEEQARPNMVSIFWHWQWSTEPLVLRWGSAKRVAPTT